MELNLKHLTASINEADRLRVWSVIITFFGDAIIPRGGAVSARTVQEVMGRLGIEPGAVRTAFSRLKQDGWVDRKKLGRMSYYHLSQQGLKPFAEATAQIYAPPVETISDQNNWIIAVDQSGPTHPILLKNPDNEKIEELKQNNYLVVSGQPEFIPDWMKDIVAPPQAHKRYLQFIASFSSLKDQQLPEIDTLAARCLLIHEWRRILLRYNRVPKLLQPEDWPESDCLKLIAELYHKLLPRSEQWLDRYAEGPDGPLPAVPEVMDQRFR